MVFDGTHVDVCDGGGQGRQGRHGGLLFPSATAAGRSGLFVLEAHDLLLSFLGTPSVLEAPGRVDHLVDAVDPQDPDGRLIAINRKDHTFQLPSAQVGSLGTLKNCAE